MIDKNIMPVDMSCVETGPMQPGEPSWASFRCGGGAHTKDITSISPYVTEQGPEPTKSSIPNEAGEFDIIPERKRISRLGKFFANLPA